MRTANRQAWRALLVTLLGSLALFQIAPTVSATPKTAPGSREARTGSGAGVLFIRAGLIETVSGETIKQGALLIRDGRIVAVGSGLSAPAGARVLDYPSAVVTPGLIEAAAGAGLAEIGMESSTVDGQASSESDPVRAAFYVADAFNPRSGVLPTARAGGVTSLVATPTGGFVSGISLWADLHADSGNGAVQARIIRRETALSVVLGLPSAKLLGGSRGIAFLRIRELFDDAKLFSREQERFRHNRLRPLGASHADLKALARVQSEGMPTVFQANRADEIRRVAILKDELGLRPIILGGTEAHLVASELARRQIPVILNPLDDAPSDFDRLHATPRNAALLERAGVPVILSTLDALDFRHRTHLLRLMAGNAARFGMSRAGALRAITLAPAQAFRMSATHGSLEPGRVANVVIWTGDPLELATTPVAVIIDGRIMPLATRQKELFKKYRSLPLPPN